MNKLIKISGNKNYNIFGFEKDEYLQPKTTDISINNYNSDEFIPFGVKNLFPSEAAELIRTNSTLSAILNSKKLYIGGKRLETKDSKLTDIISNCNINNEGLKSIYDKLLSDDLDIGNSYLQILTDNKRSFVYFNHIDASKIRLHKEKDKVIYRADWSSKAGIKVKQDQIIIPIYPVFAKAEGNILQSIVHFNKYKMEFVNYGVPLWYSAWREVLISNFVNKWNENEIKNMFNIDGMLYIPNITGDVIDEKTGKKDFEMVNDKVGKFKGAEAEERLMTIYSQKLGVGETAMRPEFFDFRNTKDGNYIGLKDSLDKAILTANVWFPLLSGFEKNTGFDTNTILNEYKLAKVRILNKQEQYLSKFKQIFKDFSINAEDLSIINESPVTDYSDIKKIWEIRKEEGLDYNENDPMQQKFFYETKFNPNLNKNSNAN